ncbi:MAG: Glyoxalase/bleomycin resistance protein/dioxygenase [Flavipsychrobacter sp.]|nr:Glyoxalase/bleomycin resistance protein/dioxygenase [Flavipsychrobacter sp.]
MPLAIKGLRTTIYKVADIVEAKKWYAAVLGIAPYFDEPFYVGFNVAGYELGLQPEDDSASDKTANVITYWGVEDVKTAFHDLLEAGATELEAPAEVGDEIVVAAVSDPWGNAFGIIYNPHFTLPA